MTKIDGTADVIIVGGGLAGLTLSCILGSQDLNVIIIDNQSPDVTKTTAFDMRTTAISFGSRRVLQKAHIWDYVQNDACPIETIDILDGDSQSVPLNFDVHDLQKDAFGWILENKTLRKALYKQIDVLKKCVTLIAPSSAQSINATDNAAAVTLDNGFTYEAPLLIGCDGRKSFVRESLGIHTRQWDYNQRAVVCIAEHDHPHNFKAIEHFRSEGPFAVLPMLDDDKGTHRSSIVWTEHAPYKNSALDLNESDFNLGLQARFPKEYGKVKLTGKRAAYPLNLVHSHSYIGPRTALVAEAAHGIHPIAGQGLNMSMRDIQTLSDMVIDAHEQGLDIGDETLLKAYQRKRRPDNMAMAGATDVLNRLFSNDVAPVKMARKIGLHMVSRFKPAKKFFMKQAMGTGSFLLSEAMKR